MEDDDEDELEGDLRAFGASKLASNLASNLTSSTWKAADTGVEWGAKNGNVHLTSKEIYCTGKCIHTLEKLYAPSRGAA